jgi:glycosyltransferase involved in cell wall biosynthesis
LINDVNSGGVFFQWGKGLARATGELVWIAESDDWCSNDFLEQLVGFFDDEAVLLAYCRTVFMNSSASRQIWSLEEYLSELDSGLWRGPFIRTANDLVREAWAVTNIVPNVSSALFRNPVNMPLLRDPSWTQMRICGDWRFYVNLIRGGLVAYTNTATNYYRIHDENTSVATYSRDIYYQEHELVAAEINCLFDVPGEVFVRQESNLKQHWMRNRSDFTEGRFVECYNLDSVRKCANGRKPALLMASYAFVAGGGETFPIQLANLFKEAGYSVTFMSFDQEERESLVRAMLKPEIPVVNNFYALPKLVRDFGIDIIHSHHAWVDNTILDFLPSDTGCKTVVSLHGMYETVPDRDLGRILPRLVERTGRLVYTADKNLGSFKRFGLFDDRRMIKIGNALESQPIDPVNLQELGIHFDAFVLCLVSRAIPDKGWDEAIQAVAGARELSGLEIHLLLIGEGQEYDRLLKEGFPEYVHLLGFRNNIRDYYAAADMGFLPSRFSGESFPLTVIDCLQAGKPVLASNVGEISHMLAGDDGRLAGCLFELQDWQISVHELAHTISRCARDESLYREMLAAVPAAVKKFDPGVMRDSYEQVYMRLFRGGTTPGNADTYEQLRGEA